MALEHGASFEPDEHIATLILGHVGDLRDRLALECVSRVWRRVGQIPGVWQSQDLTLSRTNNHGLFRSAWQVTGDTHDARVERLLRRAGPDLRSLVVNDAPANFNGKGLLLAYAALTDGLPTAATPVFVRLLTLDLSGCPGVTGRVVLDLLRQLRMHEAPEEERLQRLTLAGCDVNNSEMAQLYSTFVYHNCSPAPRGPIPAGGFDMRGCQKPDCPRVIRDGARAQCRGCMSLVCHACRQEGACLSICKHCDAFLCCIGECGDDPVDDNGDAVQVETMKSKFEAPGTKRLKPTYANLLSGFAFQ